MVKLDLKFNGKLSFEQAKLFNVIVLKNGKSFASFIGSISRKHEKNIDWWVSSPASRNNLKSPLFHYCCCIILIQELIRRNEPISEIIVDSMAFKKNVVDFLLKEKRDIKVTVVQHSVKQRLKLLILPVYLLCQDLLLFLIANLTRSFSRPLPTNSLTLIDTFVLPGYIEEDRYYQGLTDALSEKEKKCVWFVPSYIGFRLWKSLSLMRQLRKSKRNFILKEDYLKLRDYLFAYTYIFRIHSFRVGECVFEGVVISDLIREELISIQGISSSFKALTNYRFAKRLKEAGVKLRLVIDWFENHDTDRGWNAGFRRYFPDTLTRGYQGFIVTPHYLCVYPTEEERKNAVIPHEIMVIGKALVHSARKFCPDLQVGVAPAFRFKQIWQKRFVFPDAKRYSILVALPIMVSDAIHMLTMLSHKKANLITNCHIRVKPHPATPLSVIRSFFSEDWPEDFEFVSGSFNDCVEKSNLLISSVSSACIETLAKGIPVIVIGNIHGLTHNPIPASITEDIWRLCYTLEEVEKAIRFYKKCSHEKNKEYEELGKRIRKEFFETVTPPKVQEFLMLDTL